MKKFSNSAFGRFFTKFPKLIYGGLLFSVPFTICTALMVLIGYLTGFNNIIIWGLGIILAFPLYAGLVMVVRKYAVEKKDVDVLSTFKEGVKDNFKAFFLHGVITYLIIACSTFALIYYYSLAKDDSTFGAVFTLYMLFTALLLIMMFYVPIMSVTYELRLRDVYKNSFLLIFGKILRNLIALVALCFPTFLIIFGLAFTTGIWFITAGIIVLLIYPLLYSYITISIISKGMQDTVGSFTDKAVTSKPQPVVIEDYEREVANNSDSDYVFINGKMVSKKK